MNDAARRARLIALRRDLHQHPELAFRKERAPTVLHRELSALAPVSIARLAGMEIVARVAGRQSGGGRHVRWRARAGGVRAAAALAGSERHFGGRP